MRASLRAGLMASALGMILPGTSSIADVSEQNARMAPETATFPSRDLTKELPAEQVTVISSGGFRASLLELLPAFERITGIKVTPLDGPSQGSTPDTIGRQLRRGLAADVVIMSKEGLVAVSAEGRALPGSEIDLAETPLGIAVRAGAPRPDISSVDAFKTMLLTKSIALPNSTTGTFMLSELFPLLGVADKVKKTVTDSGATATATVARGEADVAVQPVSELLHVAGVDFVAKLPADIQYTSVFSAAVVRTSTHVDEAKRLVAYLASDDATAVIKNHGMERPFKQPTSSR